MAQEPENTYGRYDASVSESNPEGTDYADPMVWSTTVYALPVNRAQPETPHVYRRARGEHAVSASSNPNVWSSSWWDNRRFLQHVGRPKGGAASFNAWDRQH